MLYGEIIIGPPGSGKSTYMQYKKDMLKDRNVLTINLDPGNNITNFDFDIKSISSTREYMLKNELGPNYSVKCILNEFIQNFDDIFADFLKTHCPKGDEVCYFLFDFPGQVEFFMVSDVLRDICYKLQREYNFHLAAVNLVDCVFFMSKNALISNFLCSTIAMVLLEMPHINVISKCDNLKNFKKTMGADFDLEEILYACNVAESTDNLFQKACLEIVNNESLLCYEILDYDNTDTVGYLQMVIDKATGFGYNEDVQYDIPGKFTILDHYTNILRGTSDEKSQNQNSH